MTSHPHALTINYKSTLPVWPYKPLVAASYRGISYKSMPLNYTLLHGVKGRWLYGL